MKAHEALLGAKIKPRQPLFCSFCDKSNSESEMMVIADLVRICDKCIDLCNEIVQVHRATNYGNIEYESWFIKK